MQEVQKNLKGKVFITPATISKHLPVCWHDYTTDYFKQIDYEIHIVFRCPYPGIILAIRCIYLAYRQHNLYPARVGNNIISAGCN
jgi:hypothetical protein